MVYLTRILTLLLFTNILESQELDRVAVIVNDGVVLESDIQQRMADFKKNATLNGEKIPSDEALREDIQEQLITAEIQLQIADKVGIKISDEELNLTLKRLAQQNNLEKDIELLRDEEGVTHMIINKNHFFGDSYPEYMKMFENNILSIFNNNKENFFFKNYIENKIVDEHNYILIDLANL